MRGTHVNMIVCHFPAEDLELMLRADAPYNVAHTKGNVPLEHGLPILGDPDHVHFEVRLRVHSQSIVSHTIKLHEPFLRLKTRGFHHPRGTLIGLYDTHN